MKDRRSAFTLFELLAVLTVTGIILMVALGGYNSWSTMHACTGSARIMKAGLNQARTLAQSKNKYVLFDYNNEPINQADTPQFQIYICTNVTSATEILISDLDPNDPIDIEDPDLITLGTFRSAPRQQLPKHVSIGALDSLKGPNTRPDHNAAHLAFRPDGSIIQERDITPHSHYIGIYTKRKFDEKPIKRYLRIDLTTASIEIINDE
ncbi:MAG: prepilin-type N-terminal cleavage/methylation domain-containing protein [Kiritimatiellae bacterium]|jgi:prepilin-type N-terminal cleavage/methylation domain-containing protein|nr:prepilin-type N-terminal cleavage/methylation domain-containing protein [Kiritimatiellia bacterium]